jgi:endonuclease/exonuclease/phosphatase (EEP) superfamily protein YafD
VLDVALWIVVLAGVVAGVTLFSGHVRLAPLQALTPWLMAPSLPVLIAAAATWRWWLAVLAGTVVATLIAMGPPWRTRRASSSEPQLRVLYANVKFDQSTPEEAAAALIRSVIEDDVHVLAASEVTVTLAEALEAQSLGTLLPHRIGTPVTGPEASVMWTRLPVIERGDPGPGPTWDADATLSLDGVAVRIIATHPLPPVGSDMRP